MTDKETKTNSTYERVVGLDCHPDSFTAALVRGPTPAAAIVEKISNQVPISQLASWAKKNTTEKDLFTLEASGNSFQAVRSLAGVGRQAKVLESCHLGKLKEAHANNDKISAVRIAKAYLAGTAKEVWVPDAKTQEWRDWFHGHRKATKRLTQMRARLKSYLSDNGVRLSAKLSVTEAPQAEERLRAARPWSPSQWQVIEIYLQDLRHADQQRRQWRSLIAQQVLADPLLLDLVRLCGVREMVAFALGAFIGDIKRFDHPKKLVKYVGLNPSFDDSGENECHGGVGATGNKHLRCLLIEGAQAILRCAQTPLAQWGKKLLGRKGEINLVVAAMARKLTVAVWYLMMGRWTPLEEIDERLCVKVGKIIGRVQPAALEHSGQTPKTLREQAYQSLKDRSRGAAEAPAPQSSSAAQSVEEQLAGKMVAVHTESNPLPEATVRVLGPAPEPLTPKQQAKHNAQQRQRQQRFGAAHRLARTGKI